MRPVDFIGRIVASEGKQTIAQVEGTIFQYEDKLKGTAGWQGNLMKWQNEEGLLAAHRAGTPLLLLCNDGRQGAIILQPDVSDSGAGMTFHGAGTLSEAKTPPAWRNLDRVRAEDGAPDKP